MQLKEERVYSGLQFKRDFSSMAEKAPAVRKERGNRKWGETAIDLQKFTLLFI